MGKEKAPNFRIKFVKVENRCDEIIKAIAKQEIKKALEKHSAIAYNLDDILNKYVTSSVEEMCNDDEKGHGIR